jgi:hypothetical protein
MGFEADRVRRAWDASGHDRDIAMDLLLTGWDNADDGELAHMLACVPLHVADVLNCVGMGGRREIERQRERERKQATRDERRVEREERNEKG